MLSRCQPSSIGASVRHAVAAINVDARHTLHRTCSCLCGVARLVYRLDTNTDTFRTARGSYYYCTSVTVQVMLCLQYSPAQRTVIGIGIGIATRAGTAGVSASAEQNNLNLAC